MTIKTPVHEIINKMVEIKQIREPNADFGAYLDTLNIEEWQDLKLFAEGLTKLCDVQLKHGIRAIK